MEVACSCHQHRARCALTGRGRVKGEMAAFPGATFPLADDPAFDALDFGVAGRLLACGGAFAQQNAEGLALDLAPAGPLTRVWGPATGDAVPSPPVAGAAGAASRGAAGGGGGGAKRRRRESAGSSRAQSDAMAADDDGQFGDDEKDALDESAAARSSCTPAAARSTSLSRRASSRADAGSRGGLRAWQLAPAVWRGLRAETSGARMAWAVPAPPRSTMAACCRLPRRRTETQQSLPGSLRAPTQVSLSIGCATCPPQLFQARADLRAGRTRWRLRASEECAPALEQEPQTLC
jgi:hypothetical protein